MVRVIDGRRVAQTEMVQKVRWQPARGRVRRYFNDVVVLGSHVYGPGLIAWGRGTCRTCARTRRSI